jgi:membrane protease YdiL (CAAX protease family)
MRPLRTLGIYFVAVLLGGALLAPWLYWLAQAVATGFPRLAHQPFHRFINRSLLILALAGLWPLLRSLGATSLNEIGLSRPTAHWRALLRGLLLGFASLALVASVALAAGGHAFHRPNDAMQLAEKLLGTALSAVVVAVIEETLFRGGVFGGLRRAFPWSIALVVSSMIYAILHFLESAKYEGAITWISGLELLPRMMHGFGDWEQIVPGFFNLTLAGALLALAYQRTGNLYFSIGLHAGWIFMLQSNRVFTVDVPSANAWFWGTVKMIDGWLAFGVLSVTLIAFRRLRLKWEPDSVT